MREDRKTKYRCKCDCGKEVIIRSDYFRGKASSCGCAPPGQYRGEGDLSGAYLYNLKRTAKARKIKWAVSKTFLWKLFKAQAGKCALSGLPISLVDRAQQEDLSERTASLDRIDSDGDYTEDNVQWVHKDVNRSKMDLEEDRYTDLCREVTKRSLTNDVRDLLSEVKRLRAGIEECAAQAEKWTFPGSTKDTQFPVPDFWAAKLRALLK